MTSVDTTNPFHFLQRNADNDPKGVFSQSADQTVTNAEALVSAKKIAFELRRLGVKPGDVVALDLPDQLSVLFTEALFHEAAISTVLPDGYVSDGIFQVDWLFTKRANPTPQHGATIVHVDARFLRHVEENPYGIQPRNEPIETLRIAFSSGTTGTPKAMVFTSAAAAAFSGKRGEPDIRWSLTLLDFGTPGGFSAFLLSVEWGRPYLCIAHARPDVLVRIALEHKVRYLSGSPAQLASFVSELERQQRVLSSVDFVFSGGAVMPPGFIERVHKVLDGCRVFSSYGSTEAATAASKYYESDDPTDAGTIPPDVNLQIVDEEDRVLPEGQVGRIRYQTAEMAHEYLGDPVATRTAFRDGWFYPGDLGVLRPGRGLTLAGRESELLNAGGVKIDPTRLDNFALLIPGVIDSCSFEYTTVSGLQQIGIALVTHNGIDAHDVVSKFTAEFRGASPKLVARVKSIPRNAMGKPMRSTLAQKYNGS